jgi:hypothetical protein
MRGHPYTEYVALRDEASARFVERYFLDAGMRGDTGGGRPDMPPTQVYIFRIPRP